MTNKKFFPNVNTIEELKQQYRKLAKKYHPDISTHPEATQIMQSINNQYDKLFEKLKNSSKHTKNENVNTFKDIINELIKHDNITIDIVGSWLWVYGKGTFSIKSNLKKLN